MTTSARIVKKILQTLGSLKLTVIGLLFLIALTVWGTLYQAEFGLFRAQQRFYQSWVFLAGGWFPFPGAQSVMTVLMVNLVSSILYLARVGRLHMGLLLTHGGLVLMLGAGAVTFYFGSESRLTLIEGEGANVSVAYHDWEVAAWPATEGVDPREISAVDVRHLRPGVAIPLAELGVDIVLQRYYSNSNPVGGANGPPESEEAREIRDLSEAPPSKEPRDDRPGAVVTLRTAGGKESRLVLYSGDTRAAVFEAGGRTYLFELRRKRHLLPTVIRLLDFRKEFHPGTQIASSFSSKVSVEGEGPGRQVLISMNKPLRYKGFTFFQSSYHDLPDGREASTLAVVRNYGQVLPYVATGVTVIGMILHFLGVLVARARRMTSDREGSA
jgi:hypothetical protein